MTNFLFLGVLTIKVAAVSLVPHPMDLSGNADRLEKAFRSAAAHGAQLAVAPEGSLDALTSVQIECGLHPPASIYDTAVTLDSPLIGRFQRLARELNLCLAFGFAQRVGREVFNTAVFIDQAGAIRGLHHKMQFAEGSDPSQWYNRLGPHQRAFDTPFGRCGFMICNERWNPTLSRLLALDGADYILIPAGGSVADQNDTVVLAAARASGLPIVEANARRNPLDGVAAARSLIVDHGEIVARNRVVDAISYGRLTIAPGHPAAPAERDRLEAQFLAWRAQEMPRLYRKWVAELKRRGRDVTAEGLAALH